MGVCQLWNEEVRQTRRRPTDQYGSTEHLDKRFRLCEIVLPQRGKLETNSLTKKIDLPHYSPLAFLYSPQLVFPLTLKHRLQSLD